MNRSVELYKRRFGHAPDTLHGTLAWDNKLHFQLEWVRLRQSEPNLSGVERGIAAVKNTSFGKHRIALGFEEFDVKVLDSDKITLPGHAAPQENVPTRVKVEVRRKK